MPRLVKFFICHALIGAFVAALFVAALIWLDVANLSRLIGASDVGLLALLLLWSFNALVFGAAQIGVALTLRANDGGQDGETCAPTTTVGHAYSPAGGETSYKWVWGDRFCRSVFIPEDLYIQVGAG